MIEYPTILKSSRAPHLQCVALDKLDGSNVRVKYTKKKGFHLFGSRHQLFDETHSFLAPAIPSFQSRYAEFLEKEFHDNKLFEGAKEIVAFGEFVGEKSFAGYHDAEDETKKFVLFDLMVIFKSNRQFILPQDFIKLTEDKVEIPKVIHRGKMGPEFIQNVRDDLFGTFEGVICKGTSYSGQFPGKVWMAKIKTTRYLDSLKEKFKDDWEKYGE